MPKRATAYSIFLLLIATVVFYWQILLTAQFTLLLNAEGANQAYSWFNFWISQIRRGAAPLWDPYTFAGHSFAGEMQTSAFYPLNLVLALIPFNRLGVLSPQTYHQWFAFAHFLGACFMFALARELGLRRFASVIAGICFSLGGFVVHADWPDMLQSAIWLPLIFLFLLRALRADAMRPALVYAAASGLCLGMATLAGRLHVVIMQAIIVVAAAAFAGLHPQLLGKAFRERRWTITAAVGGVALVAFCAGAVQLLPSMEYSVRSLRFLGNAPPLPTSEKIPYAYLGDAVWPQGLLALLMPVAFGGKMGPGEAISPYIGVFPLVAAIVAVWRCWSNLWVRFLAGLAVAALLYSLGSFSLLHGALYALVPQLWMAREAGRFVYMADFSLAILAGFGIERLLAGGEDLRGAARIFTWVVVAGAAALAVPAVFGKPEMSPWSSFSLLVIFLSYGVFRYLAGGHSGRAAECLILGLVLFDLAPFNWAPLSRIRPGENRTNHLDLLLSCRGAADFLKSRPGPFRLAIFADPLPNMGDVFQIPTLSGMGATLMQNTADLLGQGNLLNARYVMRPASAQEPGPIYQDASWKIYENPGAYGGAWVTHEAVVEPDHGRLISRLKSAAIDPRRQALVQAPLETPLQPRVEGATEEAVFRLYRANRLELTVKASSRGLLVLSEIFYPGWRANVNGKRQRIYEVDGGLRGIIVPAGESRVVLDYAPWTVYCGAALSVAAFCATFAALWLHKRRRPEAAPSKSA